MPVSRGRRRRARTSIITANRQTISAQEEPPRGRLGRAVTRFRSIFYPWWKLLIELLAVGGAVIGIYVAFYNAVPDIHLATPYQTSPVEFGFYINENSPFIYIHLAAVNCFIVHTIDEYGHTNEKNIKIINPMDRLVGGHDWQIYYRCPVRYDVQLREIEVIVMAVYHWHFLGLDWGKLTDTKSLPFIWPAGPFNPQWREGMAVD
jgi:hypothetical protein